MRRGLLVMLAGVSLFSQGGTAVSAQGSGDVYMPGVNYKLPAVIVSARDIQATQKDMLAKGSVDVPIRTVEAGGHNVGVSLVYRLKGTNTGGVIHDKVSEAYQVLEGSGTLVTGGTLINPKRRADSGGNGPGISGTGIEGGVSQRLTKGDVFIIPAGTPHRIAEVQESLVYTVIRVDPSQIVPLK